jgi:hypothetical protein
MYMNATPLAVHSRLGTHCNFVRTVTLIAMMATSTAQAGIVTSWSFDLHSMNSNEDTGVASLKHTVPGRWRRGTTKSRSDRAITFRNFDATADRQHSGQYGIGFEFAENDYESLKITWKQRIGARASAFGQLQYSIDSAEFVSTGLANDGICQLTRHKKFSSMSCDLAAIGPLPIGSSLRLQIVSIINPQSGMYETTGRRSYRAHSWWSMDNVVLTGARVHVPNPGVLAVGIIARASFGKSRRRHASNGVCG